MNTRTTDLNTLKEELHALLDLAYISNSFTETEIKDKNVLNWNKGIVELFQEIVDLEISLERKKRIKN